VNVGTLEVKVLGLEAGATANVTVVGPRFSRVIARTTTFRKLTPGTYSLILQKIDESNGVESPAPRTSVKVVKGKITVTDANYFFVPKTTLTIPARETNSITGASNGTQKLIIAGSTLTFAPGEILASGPTTDRPDGYLVKVDTASTSGSVSTITAVPATLAQAIPEGSLNLERLFSSLDAAVNSAGVTSNTRAAHSISPHAAGPLGLSCGTGGTINVSPSIGFTFQGASANIDWSLFHTKASVSLDYGVSTSLSVSATGAADCTANLPLVQVDGPPIVIDAGIPVVLDATYSSTLTGTASASGSLSQTLSENLGVSMTADYPPDFSASVTPKSSGMTVQSDVSASMDLSVTASVGIKIYGTAGVEIDAGPDLKFSIDPSATPWWKLQGCITGGFSATFLEATLIDESNALSWCRILAEASGAEAGSLQPFTAYVSSGPQGFYTNATSPSPCPRPSSGDTMYVLASTIDNEWSLQEPAATSGSNTIEILTDLIGPGTYSFSITCRNGPAGANDPSAIPDIVATYPPLTITVTSGFVAVAASPTTVNAGQTVSLTGTFPVGDGSGVATASLLGQAGISTPANGSQVPLSAGGHVDATVQVPSNTPAGNFYFGMGVSYDSDQWGIDSGTASVHVTN